MATMPSSSNDRRSRRPQFFVRVEFGLSWSSRQDPDDNRISIRSRVARDRQPNFPRHVAPPSTNYLAAASIYQFQQQQQQSLSHGQRQQRQQRQQGQHQPLQAQQQQQPHQIHTNTRLPNAIIQHEAENHRARQVTRVITEDPSKARRSSRNSNHSSHGRGRSAPPPLSDNAWDVVEQRHDSRVPTGHSLGQAKTSATTKPPVRVWKDLPAVPSSFRLGEDGMPWSSMAYEQAMVPDDFDSLQLSRESSPERMAVERSFTYQGGSQPAWIAQAPRMLDHNHEETAGPARPHGESITMVSSVSGVVIDAPFVSPGRQSEQNAKADLEALGSAMMTVDNGFEDQWWSQGGRKSMLATIRPRTLGPSPLQHSNNIVRTQHPLQQYPYHDYHAEPTLEPFALSSAQMGLGWTPAIPPAAMGERLSSSSSTNVVSPSSTMRREEDIHGLSRSMSTRSEELWFSDHRFARCN